MPVEISQFVSLLLSFTVIQDESKNLEHGQKWVTTKFSMDFKQLNLQLNKYIGGQF